MVDKKKSKKNSKSKVKSLTTKEEDWDWRKELGIDVNEGDETSKSSKKVEKKSPKKQKVTKEEDWDWRKELGIDVNEGDETAQKTSQIQNKNQQKADGNSYSFIIIIILIIIGAVIYFNYSGSSSSDKGNASSSTCKKNIEWSWYINSSKSAAVFNFHNTGSKSIKLTSHSIWDSDNELIKRDKMQSYLAPGQKKKLFLYSNNTRYATGGLFQCIYDKPYGKSKKKNKDSGFKWWYLIVGYVAFIFIRTVIAETSSKDKTSNTKQEKTSEVKSSTSSTDDNFIEDVFEGKKPLGETFWLYYVVANGIISFGAGYLADVNDNNIFLIAALISNVWAGIGTWNSSTNYQLEKIKSGQPYGWAYGAKIMIVLNFLTIAGQAILLFNM